MEEGREGGMEENEEQKMEGVIQSHIVMHVQHIPNNFIDGNSDNPVIQSVYLNTTSSQCLYRQIK